MVTPSLTRLALSPVGGTDGGHVIGATGAGRVLKGPCYKGPMQRCRVLGHRYRFATSGSTMTWSCERGCGAGGLKEYASAEEASRYARAFDRRETDDLGRRAPLLGMFPLRIARAVSRRGDRSSQTTS